MTSPSTLFQVQEYRNKRYHTVRSLSTFGIGATALRTISRTNAEKLRLLTPDGEVFTLNEAGEAVLSKDKRPAAPHVENSHEKRTRLGIEQRDKVAAEIGAGLVLKKFFGGNDGPVQ